MTGSRPVKGSSSRRSCGSRATARDPQLLLLDEPFTGLDPVMRRTVAEILSDVHRERELTTIYASHYFGNLVERASRVALVREGRVEQAGALTELRTNPKNDWVAAFLADEAFQP